MQPGKDKLPLTSLIIPTYDNVEQLLQCLESVLRYRLYAPMEIIVVNNGTAPLKEYLTHPGVIILSPGENLGWEGGLRLGLEHATGEFVCFLNDDTFIPRAAGTWLRTMVRHLVLDPQVGAIGPSSNLVMGMQNIWDQSQNSALLAPFLIGFCMVVRRSALDKVGGIDVDAPGGDDIDLSIRLRAAGYTLICRKDAFVYHHGFQTGIRLRGDHTVANGWNSPQMLETTNTWLIQKHGFLTWWKTIVKGQVDAPETVADSEGEIIRKHITAAGKVYELGCGAQKTIPRAVGVDFMPKGQPIDSINGSVSVADLEEDVTGHLSFTDADVLIARHILEHCVDTVDTLLHWHNALQADGTLIIAVPNELLLASVPMNEEHVHAFTPNSLRHLVEACGFEHVVTEDSKNTVSFVSVFTKV